MGYIYIASNPSLKEGLLKIGLTFEKPEKRLHLLSRSTSIPANFVLEYSTEIFDVSTAETRIHLLLDEYRFGKEFFSVSLNKARNLVDRIANYLEEQEYHTETIGLSNEYTSGKYECRFTAKSYKYMYFLKSLSIGQNPIDHLTGFPDDVVSGFASADFLAKHIGSSRTSTMAFMALFCNSYRDCFFLTGSKNRIKVFEFLKYFKGQMAWKYSAEFRPLIQNQKI